MMFEDTYKTIKGRVEAIFKDKASKFIAIALPVKNETEVKNELTQIKKQYFDATHHCYAYRLGFDKSVFRSNDDGEPSGTAGKPIYNQILSKDLTNVLIVVIRYYGGTKLGVSGLINAYKTVAKEALDNSEIIECIVKEIYSISFTYEFMNQVMRIIKEQKIEVIKNDFKDSPKIIIAIRKNDVNKKLSNLKSYPFLKISYLKTI